MINLSKLIDLIIALIVSKKITQMSLGLDFQSIQSLDWLINIYVKKQDKDIMILVMKMWILVV
jgi:hypothetical protein